MKRVAIIGLGSIGTAIVDQWHRAPPPGCTLVGVKVRSDKVATSDVQLPDGAVLVDDIEGLLALTPDVVIEAAGQPAVVDYGERILRNGCDLIVISVGALADDTLRQRFIAVHVAGGGRVRLPVGGIAGLDGLRAMVCAGATEVSYTSIKPPSSWLGTPAEEAFDLHGMTERTVIFSGTAAQAALRYPKNANLAAAVALAGNGLVKTRVELVADPDVDGLLGIIDAEGEMGSMRVEVLGRMSKDNNKTSTVVGISAIAALSNEAASIVFV